MSPLLGYLKSWITGSRPVMTERERMTERETERERERERGAETEIERETLRLGIRGIRSPV